MTSNTDRTLWIQKLTKATETVSTADDLRIVEDGRRRENGDPHHHLGDPQEADHRLDPMLRRHRIQEDRRSETIYRVRWVIGGGRTGPCDEEYFSGHTEAKNFRARMIANGQHHPDREAAETP